MVAGEPLPRPYPALVLQPVEQSLPDETVFTRQLELAQANPGNRAESIRVLLESSKVGSSEHAALLSVQSLEDRTKPVVEKLRLLWCTPRPAEMLAQWKVKDWEAVLIFLESACKKDWECLGST